MGFASSSASRAATEQLGLRTRNERPRHGFDEPARRQQAPRAPRTALALGEHGFVPRQSRGATASRARDRDRRCARPLPRDRRRRGCRAGSVGTVTLTFAPLPSIVQPSALKRAEDLGLVQFHARQLFDTGRVEGDDALLDRLLTGYDGLRGLAAAQFQNHVGGLSRGRGGRRPDRRRARNGSAHPT